MIGIGVDLVEVARIRHILERRASEFTRRILSDSERLDAENAPDLAQFVAKRFAAKEAVSKALGTGFSQGVSWRDIALEHDELGKPVAVLSGEAQKRMRSLGGSQVLVSLSDDAGLVIAYAHLIE